MADAKPMSISKDKAAEYIKTTVKMGDDEKAKSRRVIDNGDPVAVRLRDAHTDEALEQVAIEEGFHDKWKSWGHLNRGQRRMSLGNVLRAKIRKANEPPKPTAAEKKAAREAAKAAESEQEAAE
jgi:hypothetical protein